MTGKRQHDDRRRGWPFQRNFRRRVFREFRRRLRKGLLQTCNEPVAVTRHGADDLPFTRVIADGLARFHHTTRQRRLGHHRAGPECIEQLCLADGALAILDKIDQQIENPRLDRHGIIATIKFARGRIEHAFAESIRSAPVCGRVGHGAIILAAGERRQIRSASNRLRSRQHVPQSVGHCRRIPR